MIPVTLLTSLLAAGVTQVESLPRLDPRDSPKNGSSGRAFPATSATSNASASPTGVADCNDGSWALTIENYERFMTDKNLQTWYNGGKDADGFTYPAQPKENNDLTESLASTFGPVGSEQQFICTLETGTCSPAQDCSSYGVYIPESSVGRPSHWAWFAIHSISSIYAFVQSFWKAFQEAGTALNFALLDLTKTFTKPSKDPQILTRDILIGFGFVVTAAFSLVPVAGTVIGAAAAEGAAAEAVGVLGAQAGGALSAANGILGNALSSGAPLDVKAAEFGAFMETVWNQTADGIDHLVQQMMGGSAMDGNTPLLFDMLNGGGWVDNKRLTDPASDIGALKNVMYKDLVQRGINHIWAQSKIWVSFVNLQDDDQTSKCLADKNGWQASKTCADGGVYYLYRFDEDGNENGHLSYPWGADQMTTDPWGLDPSWVTHSSALAYRSQNNGTGGFAYDPSQTPINLPLLLESISQKSGDISDLNSLMGVWNLSVCDMGTHSDWNNDFTANQPTSPYGKMAFPCCCGAACTQTTAFIRSAQMDHFDTIYSSCKKQLATCDAWPQGATQVDFGKSGTIDKGVCK